MTPTTTSTTGTSITPKFIETNGNKITFEFNGKEVTRTLKNNMFTFSKKKYFVLKNDIFPVPDKFKNITNIHSWAVYGELMKQIVEDYKKYNREDSRSGGSGIPGVLVYIYKGDIQYESGGYTHQGGYYGFNRYLPIAIKIGTNFPKEYAEKAQIEALYLSTIAKDNLTIEGKKVFVFNEYGTAFKTVGLAV